jgi:TPR repeat protein
MYNFTICRVVLFIVIFFSFHYRFALASESKIDSLTRLIDRGYLTGNFNQQITLKNTTDLYYLSQEAGFIPGKVRSIVEEANMYCNNADFESALKKINEGIDLAKSQNDKNTLCRLSLIYQRLLVQLGDFFNAKQILIQSENYNKFVDNSDEKKINTIFILLSKAELLVNNEGISKNMASVLSYKKQAYSEALSLEDSNIYKKFTLIYALESLAWSTALAEDITSARKYITKIDELLASYPNEDFMLRNLIIKGAVENVAENYHPAIKYLSEAISKAKQSHKVYILYEIYPMISASYGQLKDFENATIYSWRQKHLADSIGIVKEKVKNSSLVSTINLKISEPEKSNKSIYPVLIIVAIFLLIGGYVLYNKTQSRPVKKKDASKVIKNAYTETSADRQLEISKKLVNLAKADINVFYIEFQKVYPTFYQSLKEKYDLNISDLNFCTLIKMNFEIKQIAVYTNSTLRSVESRRYRIMKKMNLKSQNDLYILLSKL